MKTFGPAGLCCSMLAAFLASLAMPNSAFADISYSGIQNIILQGSPNSVHSVRITIAGDSIGSWDQLQLSVFSAGGSGATYDAGPGSWVTLAAYPGPYVNKLDFGDPFPLTGFDWGGSVFLWPNDFYGDPGEFNDGTGYAAMMLVGGYHGWIQLSVCGYQCATPTLTVIDWAYSNIPGETLSIGQTSSPATVPEPGYCGALTASILGLLVINRKRLRQNS